MKTLTRIALFLLLITLPFQAAIGATGWHCLTSTHHVHGIGGSFALHHHADDTSSNTVADAADTQNVIGHTSLHLLGTGECSACSSCCFAAAVVPTILPPLTGLYSSIKVSINVDEGLVSPDLDGMFRPPRITTL